MKMLLPLGNTTILRYGVNTMLSSGVSPVIVVTGRDADFIMQSLEGLDVEFVHNPDYENTQMIDSAKLGLEKIMGRCHKVIFTPGDIPLFGSEIIKKLIGSCASLSQPLCNGKTGHPICFDAALIPDILSFDGEGGLKGALKAAGDPELIQTDNKGVLMDADTPKDYEKLIDFFNKTR